MIRDPSDGSVRDPNKPEEKPIPEPGPAGFGPVIEATTSGLPTASARDADRHQRSKDWLRDYRAGNINPKP